MQEFFAKYETGWIGGVLLILLGILVRFFPILIAGYNTMTAEQKKNVNIRGLSRFMCRTLIILGTGWAGLPMLFGSLGMYKWIQTVYILWLPAGIIYLLVKAQKYDHNP